MTDPSSTGPTGPSALWEDHFGPLLTIGGAQRAMDGISLDDLNQRVKAGEVLRLRDSRRRTRYPAWQFDPATAEPYPAIADIIRMFRMRGADEWEIASFFTDPAPELDGVAPRAIFEAGDDTAIRTAATRALARLYD